MGGAVSVHSPCTPAHLEFKDLYESKKAMKELFSQIASFAHDEPTEGGRGASIHHLDIKDKICLSEVILFIHRDANPIFTKNLSKNTIPIKEAFKFAIGPKASKTYSKHEMVMKEFRKLVPALLLFSELYSIFASVDSNIDDDKIFPGEFSRARLSLGNISGVSINAISDEEWNNEFGQIDANKNGYITFNEFTKYCLSKVITPMFYINDITRKVDEEHEVIDTVGSQLVHSSIISASQKSLLCLEETVAPCDNLKKSSNSEILISTVDNMMGTMAGEYHDNVIKSSIPELDANVNNNVEVESELTSASGKEEEKVSRLTKQMSHDCIELVLSKSLSNLSTHNHVDHSTPL